MDLTLSTGNGIQLAGEELLAGVDLKEDLKGIVVIEIRAGRDVDSFQLKQTIHLWGVPCDLLVVILKSSHQSRQPPIHKLVKETLSL